MSTTASQIPVLTWIDRREQEPDPAGAIIVWGKIRDTDPLGLMACHFDYSTWVDVVESCTVDFTYWMRVPAPPDEEEKR